MIGIKVCGKLGASGKCLGLYENILEILDEKHWLGKVVKEEFLVIDLSNWANYGAIHWDK